jgi:aldehyde dehydrogenase (NAD+)
LEKRAGFTVEYAAAPESTSVVSLADRYELFIGGRWVAPTSGEYMPSVNPATETVLTEVAVGGEGDVDAAVRAARDAWPAWAALPGKDRAKYVYRIARLLLERAREFAVLETLDGGKPIKESRDVDIPLADRSSRGTSRC